MRACLLAAELAWAKTCPRSRAKAVGVAFELAPVAVAEWLRVEHVAGCGRRC
jgi:hypothetical protein